MGVVTVTVEELEQQLANLSDPDERRRMRGRIRRLRRKMGLGPAVSVTRARTSRGQGVHTGEPWEESLARLRRQAAELELREDVLPLGERDTWCAYTRTQDLQVAVEAFLARYGKPPAAWWPMYYEREGAYCDFTLVLGPL